MKNPTLTPDKFTRDRVLASERIGVYDESSWESVTIGEQRFLTVHSLRTFSLRVQLHFSNLSKFDQLSFSALNRSQETILVGLKMVHGSGMGLAGMEDISFTGARENLPPGIISNLKFPRESFGSYGTPLGWEDVRKLEITFTGEKTSLDEDRMEILVGSLFGEAREIPLGPRLNTSGLGEVLNRDVAGVTSFFSLESNRNSHLGAPEEVMGYIPFTHDDLGLLIPPPHPYPVETAQEILDGFVMGQQVGNPICWNANPLGCQEWLHFLHRHHFLRPLVRAVSETSEECCAMALDRIVESWIRSNPVPVGSNGGAGPSWETLSVAWRLREWLWVVGIVWFKKPFRPETRQLMLSSIWEHATSLMDHQGHPNNWIIVESAALALVGLCFPEFLEAEQWLQAGLERLSHEVPRQFLDDGTHFEISPLYHAICLGAMLEVKQAAQQRGKSLPAEFESVLGKGAGYLAALCRPDFTWPSINDSAGASGDYLGLMRKLGQILGRPDLKWIGSRGKSGNPPEPVSRIFPNAGITVMRSHYGRYANHLVFRSGPPGVAHVHGDVLSLDVTALGMPRLVDPGVTTYAPDVLTDHYRSAKAHNTLILDGKGPIRKAAFPEKKKESSTSHFAWTSSDGVEIATGVCQGPWHQKDQSALFCRTVMFVKGEYWIVRDILAGSGIHEVSAYWQFFPGRVGVSKDTLALTSLDARGPRFKLIPLLKDPVFKFETFIGSMDSCSGWVSINGADYPAASFAYTVKGSPPIVLVWLLIPFWGSPDLPVRAKRFDGMNGDVELEIVFPEGHRDSLNWNTPDPLNGAQSSKTGYGRVNFSRIQTTGHGLALAVQQEEAL